MSRKPVSPPNDALVEAAAHGVPELNAHRHRDDGIIRIASLVLIGGVVVFAVANADAAAAGIGAFRTFVTQYFTWYFVVLATAALVFCLYMAFGRRGRIVLGGDGARPEYSRFAWYSMLFASGQGIGLIFWSVAEPIMVKSDNPLAGFVGTDAVDGALIWGFFHWGVHGWAIYCTVALCLAISFHNRRAPMTFRDAVVGAFPGALRRGAGLVVEVVAILATVFGLATSFAFAAMQLSSGLSEIFGFASGGVVWTAVIAAIGAVAAVSVYIGIESGMKRIAEINSTLSVVLVIGVLVFGPTLYVLSVAPQALGQYGFHLWWMGLWTDASNSAGTIESWTESWNGWWTVFIWAWTWAFSTFVGSFVARISKGRTIREFVLGVLALPSLIVVVWIAVVGGAAMRYDELTGGAITAAVSEDTSRGLFVMLREIPFDAVGVALLLVATVLVGTYYVTSLDSGVHALAGFVESAARPSRLFRSALVVGIALIAFLLLTIGGETVVGTVQTGTILGALPYTVVVALMVMNTMRRTSDVEAFVAIDKELAQRDRISAES
ncbi:MAG: BCCT family transporter [Actinomycetales bacterium]|nr:BCCT family transporter [Actinomycetales bacterium]